MNQLPEHVLDEIKTLIMQGYSCREIARKAGVDKNTAHAYQKKFLDLSPECEHGKPLYRCAVCINYRRARIGDRTELFQGPRKKWSYTAEQMLREALGSILNDRG